MAKRNPEQTKENILRAATSEFAKDGFSGARVDTIAAEAGANKRMLYHYFGNKEDLFVAVLEQAYAHIQSREMELDLIEHPPLDAMRELIKFTFEYFVEHPEFIRILNIENLYGAEHIRKSKKVLAMHSPLVQQLRGILDKGVATGVFHKNIDPVQIYVSIAALSYFYLSNSATLGTIFGRKLTSKAALEERLAHVTDVVLAYLRHDSAAGSN